MVDRTETQHDLALDVIAAAWPGIVIPAACVAGVAANLEILRVHMDIVRTAAAHAPPDPAEFLAP
jgi:hypothetical protein